jgi:gluconolactonase
MALTSIPTVLPLDRARVFFDGTFAEPVRLAHPEGIAVAPDGAVWCGTETGHLMRIEPDGSAIASYGCTNGWIAGVALDGNNLYACDIRHQAVFRLEIAQRRLERFSPSRLAIPNYPVVDRRFHRLLVSDSVSFEAPGAGIWELELATGRGRLWCDRPLHFANGMALAPDGRSLYVVESTRQRVARILIDEEGGAGHYEIVVDDVREFPDGLAFDDDGRLYISCYEPSQIYRFSEAGGLELLIRDPIATLIAHPTNVAFRGTTLFATNLGRWHITAIEADATGRPLSCE